MEVEILFNRDNIGTEEQLIEMGCKKSWYDDNSDYYFSVELETMFDLQKFTAIADTVLGTYHDYIVSFDHPTIFIDNL
jgi:hypothetical protein